MVVLAITAIVLIVVFSTIACAVGLLCFFFECVRCMLCRLFHIGSPDPPPAGVAAQTTTTTTTVSPDGVKTTTTKTVYGNV